LRGPDASVYNMIYSDAQDLDAWDTDASVPADVMPLADAPVDRFIAADDPWVTETLQVRA
jgi:hypothetical protein